MHVVHVVQRYPPARGGSESYFARLSTWLAARGHHVHVASTTARDLTAFWDRRAATVPQGISVENGVTIERHPLWRVPLQRWILRGLSLLPVRSWQGWVMSCNPLSWSLRRWAKTYAGPCDVVHATAFPYGWPLRCALLLARRRRVPFVLTPFLHLGDLDDPGNPVRRGFTQPALLAILREADRVFAQTPQERDAILGLGIPPERVVLQGLGVDVAECSGGDRAGWRARHGIGPDEVVVGHLANLSAEKGTFDLIEARLRTWKQHIGFHLFLAGPQMPDIAWLFAPTRLSEEVRRGCQIHVLGELSNAERRDFFAGIDVFALPSVVDSFGLVLLEAMANGVPCVGYNAGGIPAVIQHEVDGLVVPCNVTALAHALTRLVRGRGQWRGQLGEAGRVKALASGWDGKLQIVEGVYCELVPARS
jgi:glycosyltransferase involved in cell wall biosynthesis